MKQLRSLALLATLGLPHLAAQGADSLLRINCDDRDFGAEITVNGKFRGECPLDIKVQAGTLKLRIFKPVNPERERIYEVDVRMGEDSVKKIEAVMTERLTAAGQAAEDERKRAEQAEIARKEDARQAEIAERQRQMQAREAAAAERVRADQEQLAQQTSAAEGGDVAARIALAERYEEGVGVPKDAAKAAYWYKKLADSGNMLGAFMIHGSTPTTAPEDVEAVKRMLKLPETEVRVLNVRDRDAVLATVERDPFFRAPPGNGATVFFSFNNTPNSMTTSSSCQRAGNMATIKGTNSISTITVPFELHGLLGGLVTLDGSSKSGFLKTTRGEIGGIASVNGTPFPLVADKRFGLKFEQHSSGTYGGKPMWMTQTCAVTNVRIKTGGQVPAGPQVVCLTEFSGFQSLLRAAYDEVSGCFITLRNRQI